MKQEDMDMMVEQFSEIAKSIKAGEVTSEEIMAGIIEARAEVEVALGKVLAILNGEEVEGITEDKKATIISDMFKEAENYDKKEHKKELKKVLKLTAKLDTEIGSEMFLPFMIEVIGLSSEITSRFNPKISKTASKVVDKFLEKQEA